MHVSWERDKEYVEIIENIEIREIRADYLFDSNVVLFKYILS